MKIKIVPSIPKIVLSTIVRMVPAASLLSQFEFDVVIKGGQPKSSTSIICKSFDTFSIFFSVPWRIRFPFENILGAWQSVESWEQVFKVPEVFRKTIS